MTSAQYSVARSYAGEWMGAAEVRRYSLRRGIPTDLPRTKTAVYITELADRRVAYVGQTRQGTATRLAQHARRWDRASRWSYVWVVPILNSVPDNQLHKIEGRIGQLLKPTDSIRLPRPY